MKKEGSDVWEVNPFETMASPHLQPNHHHNLDKLLQIMEAQPKAKKNKGCGRFGFIEKRQLRCHTNTCKRRLCLRSSNHCRLCENHFCNKHSMHVSQETIIFPLQNYLGKMELKNKNIKVCLACNIRVKNEWQTYQRERRNEFKIQAQPDNEIEERGALRRCFSRLYRCCNSTTDNENKTTDNNPYSINA
ncbi:uncharacterized protein [Antedon mediterranea]|uniref:uncharacterized protein n=1 Tax=Antedon mediterranea TaxID=105859 RepID=UPI003AF6B2AD